MIPDVLKLHSDHTHKALHLVRPFLPFLPEVEPVVGRKLPHREKVIYTIIVFFIFLICSNIPLFGIKLVTGADPLHWMRAILASNKHSLMELGISPITTAGLFMQLLGDTIFKVDKNVREDHLLRNAAHKLIGILLTIGMASAYVLSGVYGSIALLGIGNAMLIILQLSFAGVMVMCLDELFQKGYGYGSAISLFIATNFCANVIWKAFSPATINFGRGAEFEGAIIALIHLLVTRKDKIGALQQAFYRQNLPNVMNILATALVFLVVVYLQGFQVIVPVKPRRARGQQESFPIKLFYTNTMPIMLQSAFVSNMFFISQLLYTRFGGNFLVDLIGKWKVSSYGDGSMPVGGIVYYLAPPASLAYMAENPFHFLVYTVFMLSACAFFSKIWMDVSGSSARDVAKQLKDQDVVIVGHRDCNMQKELNRYIPTAAAFGGVCLGMLTIMADSMGALGSGTGILLAVSTIYQYLEIFEKEKGEEIGLLGF